METNERVQTIGEAVKRAAVNLESHNIEDAYTESRYLIAAATGHDRLWLHAHAGEVLPSECAKKFFSFCERRASGEPFAYIVGKKEFMGLDFTVNSSVLIPRADTEVLAEAAIAFINNNKCSFDGKTAYLDICCGSGAVGISAAFYTEQNVMLTDISSEALSVCEENALRLIPNQFCMQNSDLFSTLPPLRFSLITANPPYISENEFSELSDQITLFEPKIALLAGHDGMALYEKIIPQAKDYLKPYGCLALECGFAQAECLKKLFNENGYTNIETLMDINNIQRVVKGELQ